MSKLFWGIFLLSLDFSPNLGNFSLNILPDWAGFVLLYLACGELLQEGSWFQKPRSFCIGGAIYTLVLWAADLLPLGEFWALLSLLLNLAAIVLRLYVIWLVIDAIANMEMCRNYDLRAAHLRKIWKVFALCNLATYATLLIPLLMVISALATVVVSAIFLFAVHNTGKLYRQMLCDCAQS